MPKMHIHKYTITISLPDIVEIKKLVIAIEYIRSISHLSNWQSS